ncbi:MAG TPA: LysR substrate-binding domain-containing protein [Streptosporangiaceae bacterium]|nr:LysR substrate-binding domain-containing protein [Streptosporangiaceae bacterium]
MELRQLEYLVTVVEEASFTRAAERCHVAQPGVSAQIRLLERELGQTLLDRSGRTVRPTEVGAAVLPYARAALSAVDGIRLAIEEMSGLVRGHLSVGMVSSVSAIDLPAVLAQFAHRHPGVEITLRETDSAQLLDALTARLLDAALIGLSGPLPTGIEATVVGEVPLVAIVAPTDPLSTSKAIKLEALVGRRLITLPKGTGLRAVIDQAFAEAGLHPHVAFEASDPYVLAQLAGHGLGVAIATEPVARAYHDQLPSLAIAEPSLLGRQALAWRAEGPISPAARAFISHARAMITDRRGPL